MSNPPSSLHQAPKPYHRRQNSTPVVAFEAMKVSSNTPTMQQRQGVHQRGLSFDQQNRSPIRRQQPGGMVSITNVAQQLGQQILREAQQQRASRPGQQIDLPVQHPQCGMYPGSTPNSPYETMTMNSIMQSSPHMQFDNSPYYPPDISSMQAAGYQGMGGVDENSQHYFQQLHQARQQPNAVFDARRLSQPELRVQTGMRPHTPQDQMQTGKCISEYHCPVAGDFSISRLWLIFISTISTYTTYHPNRPPYNPVFPDRNLGHLPFIHLSQYPCSEAGHCKESSSTRN